MDQNYSFVCQKIHGQYHVNTSVRDCYLVDRELVNEREGKSNLHDFRRKLTVLFAQYYMSRIMDCNLLYKKHEKNLVYMISRP
jgi:hypothetical protein